jgi:hypothetical protein
VAASEPTSLGRRGPELRNTWQRRSPPQQGGEVRSYGPRGSTRAHLNKEVRSGAAGHVAAPKPTSAGRCGPKLQLTWQRVDARPAPCLDLELVYGGTRSSGCRQRPPDPPRERPRTCRWGQFFNAPLGYLIFLLGSRRHAHHKYENVNDGPLGAPTINVKTSTAGTWEVPELKVRERPPST